MTTSITPQELSQLKSAGTDVNLIDVRTPAEFGEAHIPFARNYPLERLNPTDILQAFPADTPLYVVCQSGRRGEQACQKLLTAGHGQVINVEGGTKAWIAAGQSVIRGKKTISLERQVRIAAGFLVVAGAALGFFVHPYWIGLSAFVGAGLMFAGITDTCGMAMVLARMPWNQAPQKPASTASCKTESQRPSCCS